MIHTSWTSPTNLPYLTSSHLTVLKLGPCPSHLKLLCDIPAPKLWFQHWCFCPWYQLGLLGAALFFCRALDPSSQLLLSLTLLTQLDKARPVACGAGNLFGLV